MTPLIVMIATLAVGAGQPSSPDALHALAEAERSFARACVQQGIRASFLEFFAPDGVLLTPSPANARDLYSARPAPAQRPPVTLDWAPVSGEVAASGDWGWTTGPYTLSDDTGREPKSHGYYVSIWKKQPDGAWRVALDIGTEMPSAESASAVFGRAAAESARPGPSPTAEELRALDATCATGDCLAEGARLHRVGAAPSVGREAVRAALAAEPKRAFTPLGAEAAPTGDWAYTYGTYSFPPSPTHALDEGGAYLHVWRRETQGWRLAVDVVKPAPKAAK